MSRNRRRTERKQADTSSKRRGGNRWCRLHVECLEGRLLLSGNSLLGALESAPTALLSTLGAVTGLQQPTLAPTDSHTGDATSEPSLLGLFGQHDLSGQQDSLGQQAETTSGTGLGISLNLGGLVSAQIGGAATKTDSGDSSAQATTPALLNLSLDSSASSIPNPNSPSDASGVPTGTGLSVVVSSPSVTGVRGSATAVGQEWQLLHMLVGVEVGDGAFGTQGDPPGGFLDPGGPMVDDAHAPPMVDVHVFTLTNVDQLAQSLGQGAAKDARQSDDPHAGDVAAAAVTARGSDVDNGAFQAARPAPVVSTSQIPTNPTSASTSVTDAAEQQLSLVARAAAAVMPAALGLAGDAIIAQSTNTDPDAATNAPADDANSPSDSSVATVQAAANLVPAGLLAIAPGDLRAVDQALERLLDEIDALGGGLVDYAASSDLLQWATAGIGAAACVGGAYFHRKRRNGSGQSLEEESASWMFSRMQSLAADSD